jgi:hypothetical protein
LWLFNPMSDIGAAQKVNSEKVIIVTVKYKFWYTIRVLWDG